MRIILASKSPRRKELLARIVTEFEIITKETDETLPADVHPRDGVAILAVRKGNAVANELSSDALVISSDTLVELDGIPLGKPESEEDAFGILSKLSGHTHNVHTGVAVHYMGRVISGVDSASVTFRKLSPAEIREYIATGEPMDKAGAYAIQGIGNKFIEKYDGNFDTIMGLGTELTKSLIDEAIKGDND